MQSPYISDPFRYLIARLYIDDVLAAKLAVGSVGDLGPDGSEYYEEAQVIKGGEHTFTVLLDLNDYASLTVGQDYRVHIALESSSFWDGDADASLRRLYELAGEDPQVDNWAPFDSWEHGDWVYGNTDTPRIRWIKRNQLALEAVTTYANYPCIKVSKTTKLFGKRKRRWLMYRNEEESPVVLGWNYRGEYQEVGLPDASEQTLAVDLDSFDGMNLGRDYNLDGVMWAIEDDDL
jgi:hypothetical protein